MAEPRMTSPDDDGREDASTTPFDRRALQATLADAVRTGEPEDLDQQPGAPLRGAPVPPPEPSVPPALSADDLQSRSLAPRALNPFGRPLPAGPQESVETSPAPPRRPAPSMLGGSGITSVASGGIQGGMGSGGLGGLRSPGAGNIGPINLGASLVSGGLLGGDHGAGRVVSDLAPTETERPTIPLRRPKPVEPPSTATAAGPVGMDGLPTPAVPRVAVAQIESWAPADDDILPTGQVRRRSMRGARHSRR